MSATRTIDLFCGAGGSSWGARLAGAEIVGGFDLSERAGEAYRTNFPDARFYQGALEYCDPLAVKRQLKSVDLILASPECTNHSPAKGSGPRSEKSKETAFQVVRFVKVFLPRWVVIENVVNMRAWSRFPEFIDSLRRLGYHVLEQPLDASDFGVPQTRRRLFILCDLEKEPKPVTPRCRKRVPASEIVCDSAGYRFTPLRAAHRSPGTIARAERAIAAVGNTPPFLLVYYGSDHAGGWQSLARPLRTVTTLDRFAYVKHTDSGHVMRMLQVPELKAAMGMPQKFCVVTPTRRESIRLLGNGVCPPVMRAVVSSLRKST